MKEDNRSRLIEMMFKVSRLMKEEMSYTNNLVHLSILQIQTLIFLHKNKKVSMSNIAEHFHIELSSATSLITKLYSQKLIERHTDEEDRRLVRITLTEKGSDQLKQAMCERRKKMEKTLAYLSDKQRSELSAIFETLFTKLQKKDE
ncbi:MAG: MarR family transcriptional regulator [Candidatus Roizmanbacteria bacterium]|nr:MarR family transcriptional regulator [Candidatus Roizmanbacteria bacterium]